MKIFSGLILGVLCTLLEAQVMVEGSFEKAQPGRFPSHWTLFSGNAGSVSAVRSPFDRYKNAVRIAGPVKKNVVLVYGAEALPVKKGDTVLVEVVFKTSRAQKVAYGFCSSSGREKKMITIPAYSSSWDRRNSTIQITDDSTKSIRPVVMACAGGKDPVEFSYIQLTRLEKSLADLYSVEKSAARFRAMTQGNNLARKGRIHFHPAPVYPLTARKGTDGTDLIDGKLSKMNAMWFDPCAVGFTKAYNGTSITVDLGKVCDVSKAVIRLQGGRIFSYTISFPDILEVWISKNGRDYYLASSMRKLKATESSMADWKDLYYLPEVHNSSGIPYVYAFEMPVMAQARYVMFRAPVYAYRSMFSDELAVMEAVPAQKKSVQWNSAYKKSPRYMNHNSVMIYPKMETFYISEGIRLPNLLTLENLIPDGRGTFAYEMEFPSVVKYVHDNAWPSQTRIPEKVTRNGSRVTYRFRSGVPLKQFIPLVRYGFGPFYFYIENGQKIPKGEDYVLFRTFYNGKEALTVKRPLASIAIPKIKLPEKLDISMWFEERYMQQSDHIDAFRKCGFTSSMFFPRNVSSIRANKALYDRAVRENFKIRLELEPVNTLRWKYPKVTDYRCVGAEKFTGSVCLAYRGKYYLETVAEVKAMLKERAVHAVTFDIEAWEPANMNLSMRCSRCRALKEKKGYKSWIEYLTKEQFEYVKAYTQAVREGAKAGGHKVPYIGYYAVSPVFGYRCLEGKVPFLGYPYLYPAYTDEIQSSFYGRSTIDCHKQMRTIFKHSAPGARRIPWLSAGTGAYYSYPYSRRNEQHIVETLMNGATGLQFYARKSFESPLDYYYTAKGIGALAPHEEFLFKGTLEEKISCSNQNLCSTVRQLGKEYLILVGNYESRTEAQTCMTLPGKIRFGKLSAGKGKVSFCGRKLTLRIGPDDYVLVRVSL